MINTRFDTAALSRAMFGVWVSSHCSTSSVTTWWSRLPQCVYAVWCSAVGDVPRCSSLLLWAKQMVECGSVNLSRVAVCLPFPCIPRKECHHLLCRDVPPLLLA